MKVLFFSLVFFFSSSLLLAVQPALSPEQAIGRLREGNQRYVEGSPIHPDQSEKRRETVAPKQNPFAVIVSCSDSRVPPEIIFDQGIGDLFIVRVAGNVVGPIELDSIEYSAIELHCPLIVVMGHEDCGAVKAVLAGKALPEEIENIAPLIQPAIDQSKKLPGNQLVNAIQSNVKLVVEKLKKNAVLQPLIQKNQLKILGAYYELKKGNVEIISP